MYLAALSPPSFFPLRRRLLGAFHPDGACGLNALPSPPDLGAG